MAFDVTSDPAILNPNVATIGPAQLLQRVEERCDASLTLAISLRVQDQHSDPANPVRLLCTRQERPRECRTAHKRYELAQPHCSPFEFQSPLSYRIKQ